MVGAPGVVLGVAKEAAEDAPPPFEFCALIVIEYDVPFARPVILSGVADPLPSVRANH